MLAEKKKISKRRARIAGFLIAAISVRERVYRKMGVRVYNGVERGKVG